MPPPSDDELPDERELAALYARLPKTEPDAALDAAVLAAATRGLPVRRRPRWPVALGSAAVLVLAVGVGWHMKQTPIRDPIAEKAAVLTAAEPASAPAAAPAPPAASPSTPAAAPAPPPGATFELSQRAAPPSVGARSRAIHARDTTASTVGAHPGRDAVRATPARPQPQYLEAR
ncbi:MAG: hypothetical protein ACTHLF_07540, partial [Luteibacter sp.]